MATTATPWGQTPLTAEALGSLDHPLSLSDFNQDAGGYWRIIRGQKTYYPREWFDQTGTFTGTGTQAGDPAGQDQGFFHTGMHWNWEKGQWENPVNWANVIGLAAAGGVGGAFVAPYLAGALAGGGGAAAGGSGYVASDVAATAAASTPAALGGTAAVVAPSVGEVLLKQGIAPAITAGTSLINTKQQVDANADAVQKQIDANKYAADLQAKAAADALAFQRQQADYHAQVAESTRSANYDQWAAKQRQLGTVGDALGLPARAIPAYVPLPPSGLGAPVGAVVAPGAAPAAVVDPGRVGVTDPGQTGPGATPTAPTAAPPAGADAAWWNPADPKGSVASLFGGAPPTSQAILDRKAQIEAAGGQVSPANAEGVTSKIYLPGVGWTRVLDGGVAGGQGTGWTYVPQGTGAGGGAPGATAPRLATGNTDALGAIAPYLLDQKDAIGTIRLPRYAPLGAVGSYV